MDIKHEEHHRTGSFYVEEDGSRVAEMKYLVKDGVMNIYHTEVDPKMQGQNIGFKLVQAGVNFARQGQLKVLPTCTFAKSVFERTKDFQDVLI
jgi:predicted GNAT family acetyltransferase